ncbi:hypothetical protein SynMITS9220_02922 [Synechococcus sp. MIT S9220]|nr:hypothetical protein SynMITS9220_02922 [Synechococcus sp. MIT S9220]
MIGVNRCHQHGASPRSAVEKQQGSRPVGRDEESALQGDP